jgi:hypothetical protein
MEKDCITLSALRVVLYQDIGWQPVRRRVLVRGPWWDGLDYAVRSGRERWTGHPPRSKQGGLSKIPTVRHGFFSFSITCAEPQCMAHGLLRYAADGYSDYLPVSLAGWQRGARNHSPPGTWKEEVFSCPGVLSLSRSSSLSLFLTWPCPFSLTEKSVKSAVDFYSHCFLVDVYAFV